MNEFKNGVNYITEEDVLLVKRTNLVRPYQSQTEGFKGKNYRLYALGDKAFAVHEDDNFHDALASGDIQKIEVLVSDEGWSMSNFVTWTQANNFKTAKVRNEAITVQNFVAGKLNASTVNALLQAANE